MATTNGIEFQIIKEKTVPLDRAHGTFTLIYLLLLDIKGKVSGGLLAYGIRQCLFR